MIVLSTVIDIFWLFQIILNSFQVCDVRQTIESNAVFGRERPFAKLTRCPLCLYLWINIFRLNPSSLWGWGFYTSPWKTLLSNFWNSQHFDMKLWLCILNLICHHLSKYVVTIDKMTSLKNDVLSRWPLRNL